MTLRAGTLVCLIALVALTIAGSSAAEPQRSRVAIVRTASADALLREANTRLRAELLTAGFEVVDVASVPGDPRSGVERASEGSFATVAMARTGTGALADVWISDHVTGKTVVRRLRVGTEPNAAAILAIRALELLRASLLEVSTPKPAAEPRPAAPPDVLNWVKPDPAPERAFLENSALSAGVFALHDLHDIGLALGPTLRLSHGIVDRWFGRLAWAGPLFSPTLRASAGEASVRQHFLSLDLGWATEPRPLALVAWVGAGAYLLQATGASASPYRSTSDSLLSFLVTAGVGGLARLGESFALLADVSAVGLAPRPVVAIAEHEAGPAGGPSLGASLALVVRL
jgi:hypothetical protein